MELIEGRIESKLDQAFPGRATMRETIALSRPATTVQVFLRGFDVSFYRADHHLNNLAVMLEVVSGTDSAKVDVIARITLKGHSFAEDYPGFVFAVSYTVLAQ